MTTQAQFILMLAVYLWLLASYIDARYKILPDAIHLTHITLAVIFHFFVNPGMPLTSLLLGAVTTSGALLLLALVFDAIYGRDTLGMGDIKLFFAAGFWLGFPGTVQALSIGSFFACLSIIVFMLAKRRRAAASVMTMEVPAGPGFILGILIVLCWQYQLINF